MSFSFLLFFIFWMPLKTQALTVYGYDSLLGSPEFTKLFEEPYEKKFNTKIKWVGFPSAGEAVNQIFLEAKNPKADVLLGFDSLTLVKLKEQKLLYTWQKKELAFLETDLPLDKEGVAIPFDYGFLAFVYDSKLLGVQSPCTLLEFAKNARFRKKVVVMDPRTSSLGINFLAWTHAKFQEAAFLDFWNSFRQQILTAAPSWSSGYTLFLKKDANFTLSFTTSPAYHVEKERNYGIRAQIFTDGHYQQTEWTGILQSSLENEKAQKFIQILLSSEVQSRIPTLNWMYPARRGISLPRSIQNLPKVEPVEYTGPFDDATRKAWLKQWPSLIKKKK